MKTVYVIYDERYKTDPNRATVLAIYTVRANAERDLDQWPRGSVIVEREE